MNKIWKDIPNCEGYYQASSEGEIKSLEKYDSLGRKRKEKTLKPTKNHYGYLTVELRKQDGKRRIFMVHKLIAMTFIPNPDGFKEINHRNGRKDDNRVCNLEYCTHSENMKHAYKTGLHKVKRGKESALAKKVIQYDKQGEFIKKWDCVVEVENVLKINHSHISDCCKGKRKTAGGCIWRYDNGFI